MTPTPLTTDPQTLTATGPAAPTTGLDISGLSGDYMLELEVMALSAATGTPRARIVIEDTVNAFTAAIPVAELNIEGPINQGVKAIWRKYSAPSLRLGTASAKLRVNVVTLEGGTPTVTVRGALWQ
jgi:hypothetical protein